MGTLTDPMARMLETVQRAEINAPIRQSCKPPSRCRTCVFILYRGCPRPYHYSSGYGPDGGWAKVLECDDYEEEVIGC